MLRPRFYAPTLVIAAIVLGFLISSTTLAPVSSKPLSVTSSRFVQQEVREHDAYTVVRLVEAKTRVAARVKVRSHTAHTAPRATRTRRQGSAILTSGGSVSGILARIRGCESGSGPNSPGNYRAENRSSSASGAYQFLDSTWRSTTGLRPPASAYSPAVQDAAARKLFSRSGTSPWAPSRHCWG